MLGGAEIAYLYVVAARWPGVAALPSYTDWAGQVLRTRVPVAGAGWPAR
jgi:sugar lactone lactonase YvrE